MEKKAKAEAKRARRMRRKQGIEETNPFDRLNAQSETSDADSETPDGEPKPSATPDEPN